MRLGKSLLEDQSEVCLSLLLEAQVLELGWTITFAIVASRNLSELAKEKRKMARATGRERMKEHIKPKQQGNGKKEA
jgi:hypothetical protein